MLPLQSQKISNPAHIPIWGTGGLMFDAALSHQWLWSHGFFSMTSDNSTPASPTPALVLPELFTAIGST
jgi:hypothetical protein